MKGQNRTYEKEISIAVWNAQGLKDNDKMIDVLTWMKRMKRNLVLFTETHFDNYDYEQYRLMASNVGFKCFSIMRLMRRGDHGSGGVLIMVEERMKCRLIRKSKYEDLIWVCIEWEDEKLFVGGAYLVPPSSSRARKADELVEEIGRDVARFCLEGETLLAGDWNCKIGQLESVARERTFVRKSVSNIVDVRGRRMMNLLNLSDMVVLNGVKEKEAQFTCKAVRGEGIDDYIAVSCGLVERMSDIEYWKGEESDHVAIACKMQMKCERKKEKKVRRLVSR